MRADEVMTAEPRVASVSPETPLKAVARLLLERGISGVPVVDPERRVLGVVSEADIVRSEAGGAGRAGVLARARAFARVPAGLAAPVTAGEAMTSPALTIRPDQTVVEAVRLIVERGVNRLPVVDEGGKLLGIVTRADVVRAFTRSDADIAGDVREGVVARLLGSTSSGIEVSVEHGQVELSGDVDTTADARVVEYFASRVPGVVAVRSHLRSLDESDDTA